MTPSTQRAAPERTLFILSVGHLGVGFDADARPDHHRGPRPGGLGEARAAHPRAAREHGDARPPRGPPTDIATFLVGFGLFGSFVLIPQLAQLPKDTGYGFAVSATAAGLLLAPSALLNLFLSPLSGRMGGRLGARVSLAIGCATATLALGLLALAHGSPLITPAWAALLGVGVGFAFLAMPNLIIEAVDRHETGTATGVNTIARNVGASLGSAVGGSILAGNVLSSGFPTDAAFTAALGVSALGSLVAAVAAISIPARRERGLEPLPATG